MPRLDRPGCVVEYSVEGTGDRGVVLLHNLLTDRRSFAGVARHLSATHRVILVDLRGHGASGRPERAFSVADLAGDVAAILDAESLPSAAIVGQSLGGLVAMELALAQPQRVAQLCVLCSTARAEPFIGRQRMRVLSTVMSLFGPIRFVSGEVAKVLFSAAFRKTSPVEVQTWRARIERLDGRGAGWAASSWGGRRSLVAELPSLRVPALVVAGEGDVACSVAEGEEIARLIEGAQLHVLPGGHTMSVEQPVKVAELLAGFLA